MSRSNILISQNYFFAGAYHQQYLDKNPHGYCGLGGTGVSCPIGIAPAG
jgi:peptide-methionine (S)-S-oxide reductase